MPYLVQSDYNKTIQADNLAQVLGAAYNPAQAAAIQTAAEFAALEEAKSYLVQKYDCTQEFTDTLPWNPLVSYNAKSRVIIDYPAFNATSIYALKSLVVYQGNGYICTTAITIPAAWNISNWALLGAQYSIFYAALPNPEFVYTNTYVVGDMVFWKNKIYTCKKASIYLDGDTRIQFIKIQNIPYGNVFPDDPVNGAMAWGTGTPYSVAAGTILTNTAYWTLGDNRSQQLVTYFIDIVLYHLHSRIAPRNIPDLRVKRRDEAIQWLNRCAKGDVTPNLPVLQPKQGARIRYGGNTKQRNTY